MNGGMQSVRRILALVLAGVFAGSLLSCGGGGC